jgi:hypothetical protein
LDWKGIIQVWIRAFSGNAIGSAGGTFVTSRAGVKQGWFHSRVKFGGNTVPTAIPRDQELLRDALEGMAEPPPASTGDLPGWGR